MPGQQRTDGPVEQPADVGSSPFGAESVSGLCYAGIGSRIAPPDMQERAERAAEVLAEHGWTLRTGHAPGMDQAFERGAGRRAEVFLPWPTYERSEPLEADVIVDRPTSEAYNISAGFHPAWDALSSGAKALHARNAHQVLGRDLNDPVRFVLCWTPKTRLGGTGQAIRIARRNHILVYDMEDADIRDRIDWLVNFWTDQAA